MIQAGAKSQLQLLRQWVRNERFGPQYLTIVKVRKMKYCIVGLASLLLMILTCIAPAQELPTQNVPADRSTPRGTLKVLAIAIQQADTVSLKSILLAKNPQQQQMIDAMIQTAVVVHDLHTNALSAWGADQAATLIGPLPASAEPDLSYLNQATESIDGNNAVVTFKDVQSHPVRLEQTSDQWQVPVETLADDLKNGPLDERIAQINRFNNVIATISQEIKENKYRTAEQAKQALYNLLMQSEPAHESGAPSPTSAPANDPITAPTTQPAVEAVEAQSAAGPDVVPTETPATTPATAPAQ